MRKKSREATRPSEAKAPQNGDRGHLRSPVFPKRIALNVGIFGRKLEAMEFGPCLTERLRPFWISSPGGRAIKCERSKIARFGHF